MPQGLFHWKIVAMGLATWLVPFVAGFAFFDQTGALWVPEPLFKSLMIVLSGAFGTWMIARAFRQITPSLGSGAALGVFWLAINVGLDLLILLPFAGYGFTEWLIGIGLRYLLIPIIAIGMGVMGGRA
ncbi:MAG: hypothetical protein QNJ16_08100 [Rhodobacter sp.]|nr:hypothetical protein [Rhodobacter sp.]